MNEITMKMQADQLIRMALQEDITSEDVSTNAVMRSAVKGTVDLIAKEDGIIAGLDVYARVFQILVIGGIELKFSRFIFFWIISNASSGKIESLLYSLSSLLNKYGSPFTKQSTKLFEYFCIVKIPLL